MEEIILENQTVAWEVAGSAVMRKWKSLFVNGYEYKNPISEEREFLRLYQERTNVYVRE
jgi:hypothetical protein